MRKFRLLFVTLLISSLLAPQVLAETSIPPETEAPAASPVITVGGSAGGGSGLSTATSAPSTIYPAGSYHAGTDIPSGEYVLLADNTASYGIYIIYENASEDADYVDYNTFDYNAIIRLEDGQVLSLNNCTASPLSEVPQIDHYYGNMYKVGYHIPAGTYELKSLDSSSYGIAYVLSYPSDNYDVVEDYTYVEGTAAITVKDGQYLQLSDCILSGTASAASATPNHNRTTSSWYDEWTSAAEQVSGDEQRSSLITAGYLIPGLPTKTSTPSTVYQPGTYQGGTDIPAGEYVLLGNDRNADEYSYSSACTYMISTVSTPEELDQILDYGSFYYNTIIRLEEGQFLTYDNCTASPIDQVPSLDYRRASHFKVGYHIPAGTYYFRSDGYGIAYILSSPSLQYRDIVDYETTSSYGRSTISLTVQDGQYLFLAGCEFTNSETTAASPGPGGEATDSRTAAYMDYLKQLYGYEEEETTSQVITAPAEGCALSATTSVPSTVYPEGSYEAGTEIPAGEYMLLCSDYSDSDYTYGGAYVISTAREASDYDQIIDYNYFSYNAIIRIAEGQYLYLVDCTASPVDEVPQLDYSRGEMYKVGLQLPAGTYRLKSNGSSYSYGRAYILSAPSDNYEDVVESFTVSDDANTVVTVKSGQYLQLKNCFVAEAVSSDTSSTGPAFAAGKD